MRTTAKIKLTSKHLITRGAPPVVDEVGLQFHADYDDDRNQEWAKYTPALSVAMTVLPEVAERFEVGQAFTLTFEPEVSE